MRQDGVEQESRAYAHPAIDVEHIYGLPFKSLCRQAGLPLRQKNKILPRHQAFYQVGFYQLNSIASTFFLIF
jgi:hypothetical protein